MNEFGDTHTRRVDRVVGFGIELVGSNNIDISDADKAEYVTDIRRCKIDRAVNRYAARAYDDIGFFPLSRPSGPFAV